MAEIRSGNVEVYIRQLLSEVLENNVGPEQRSIDDKLLKDENIKLANRRLRKKSKEKMK